MIGLKFNPECVRDILIAVEERTDGESMEWLIPGPGEKIVNGLAAYSRSESAYHIKQCARSGLIAISPDFIDGSFAVFDLTPDGHRALADLRKPRAILMWEKAVSAGVVSSLPELLTWLQGIA